MITGLIVGAIIIAMIICAGNGEWGPFAVGAVLCVILIGLHSAGTQTSRAYNNFVDYWANGGKHPESAAERKKKEESQKRTLEELNGMWKDPTYVDGAKTAGDMLQLQGTTYPCPMCGSDMGEFNRIRYSSGTVYVNYLCPKCKKKLPVKVA